MDKKLIQEYGQDILCYRIRTARQKKRMRYKDFDKRLIALHKEEKALGKQKDSLGWVPLVPPYQRGWQRFYVLREDVRVSKNAAFFENILAKINTHDWSHRKDFMIRRRRYGRKKYEVKEQKLLQPTEDKFAELKFSEAEKQFFHLTLFFDSMRWGFAERYVFTEPWRFVLRIRPKMIDKVRAMDNVLESRLKEIDNYLDRNAQRNRQGKLLYGKVRYRHYRVLQKHGEENPFKGKPFQEILRLIETGDL
jgi:hypothetical protein